MHHMPGHREAIREGLSRPVSISDGKEQPWPQRLVGSAEPGLPFRRKRGLAPDRIKSRGTTRKFHRMRRGSRAITPI